MINAKSQNFWHGYLFIQANYRLHKSPCFFNTAHRRPLIDLYKSITLYRLLSFSPFMVAVIFRTKSCLPLNWFSSQTRSDIVFQQSSTIFRSGLLAGHSNTDISEIFMNSFTFLLLCTGELSSCNRSLTLLWAQHFLTAA